MAMRYDEWDTGIVTPFTVNKWLGIPYEAVRRFMHDHDTRDWDWADDDLRTALGL